MTKQMLVEQKRHKRELEEWKERARRSADGRYSLGAGCFIVYTRQETIEFPAEAQEGR